MELFLVWLVSIIIATMIGQRKGTPVLAFMLGVVLGPLGVLIVLASSGNRLPCPYCREKIIKGALKCPHCQSDLGPPPLDKVKPAPGEFTNAYGEAVKKKP